jgi:hypothetical protein
MAMVAILNDERRGEPMRYGLATVALLGALACETQAGEPLTLTEKQMDSVTAGGANTVLVQNPSGTIVNVKENEGSAFNFTIVQTGRHVGNGAFTLNPSGAHGESVEHTQGVAAHNTIVP